MLFGDYNPAGRVSQTWVASMDQLPPMMDYDLRHGRTYMYLKDKPLYVFGYGLSYTKFAYSNLRVSTPRLAKDGSVTVSVDVKNTGKRDGDEVVELYAVSYTHLIGSTWMCRRTILRTRTSRRFARRSQRPMPVSYTHLDVYKRQP